MSDDLRRHEFHATIRDGTFKLFAGLVYAALVGVLIWAIV